MTIINETKSTQSMISIKKRLVNSISIIFAIIIFAVYLSIDLSLDSWVDKQFDKTLVNEANTLKSLVSVSHDSLKFEDDRMADFHSEEDAEYYQLWYKEESFKRSSSLKDFPDIDLLKVQMPLNSSQLLDVKLPNGEVGRASISYFLPESEQLSPTDPHPAYLALYQSTDTLEDMLVLVDALLIITFFLSIFSLRYIAVRIVEHGLKPLVHFTDEIKEIDIEKMNTFQSHVELSQAGQPVKELEPIRLSINAFIKENQQLMQKEKRLTGDIAHELKTPIAEIISLSEVYIRYPNDERIGQTYKEDMLSISLRMKNIVEQLMILQRTSSTDMLLETELIDIKSMVAQVIQELEFKYPTINNRVIWQLSDSSVLPTSVNHILENDVNELDPAWVKADRFSLHTIIFNLLDNALFYSVPNSKVSINMLMSTDKMSFSIRNDLERTIKPEVLDQLFAPLYQADQSRTSNERFGLGLSIVSNICKRNRYKLSVSSQNKQIEFKVNS